jgi:hypothetical protein
MPIAKQPDFNTTLDLSGVPTWVLVISGFLLSLGMIAAVMVFLKFFKQGAYFRGCSSSRRQRRRDSAYQLLSPLNHDDIRCVNQDLLDSASHIASRSNERDCLDCLIDKLVILTADDADKACLVLPASETERICSWEI